MTLDFIKDKYRWIFTMIGFFALFTMVPNNVVYAALGDGDGTCSVGTLPGMNTEYGATYWQEGPQIGTGKTDYIYATPSIQFVGGTVYERYLTAGDFQTIQTFTYQQHYSKTDRQYQDYQKFKWIYDDTCNSYQVPAGGGSTLRDTKTAVWKELMNDSRTSGISVSIVSDGRYSSGVTTSQGKATYSPGGTVTATGNSYWVSKVTITPGPDTLEDEAAPTASCIKTYGNGVDMSCAPTSTQQPSGTYIEYTWKWQDPFTSKKDEKKNRQWFFKDITLTNSVSEVWVDGVRGATSNPEVLCVRNYFNGMTRDCRAVMHKDPNKYGWSLGGGTRTAYFKYEYTGPRSGIYDKKEQYRTYYYVVLVEFPVEENSKDAYVSTSVIYNDDAPAPPLVEEAYSVACYKTFADGKRVECLNGSPKLATSMNSQGEAGYPGGSHPSVTIFVHNTNKNGWALGGPVRHNFYSFEENKAKAEWTVNMLYVTKVEVENGTPEDEFVAVNETHLKKNSLGIPTKATDPQETDPYTPPTCEKTFAADSNGVQQIRNCFPQIEWNFNFNKWGMGGAERILRFKYKENLKEDEWKIHFTYVSKVDITISKDYLFQDEDYGTYSCIKTYHQTFIGGGNTKDCLERMYIDSDSGQNMSMGGQRKINYDYINNGHKDLTLQTRVYANKTVFTSTNATEGYSGHRELYTCDVLWQDSSRKDVTNEPLVWTSTAYGVNGEQVNFIGEEWVNGYVDIKGNTHKPNSISEFYVPDPVSKDYYIHCIYPELPKPPYNNGLRVGWSFAEDKYAPGKEYRPFDVIGIQEIQLIDDTTKIHEIDLDENGDKMTSSKEVTAAPFTGTGSSPETFAFNDKTYQTGHWYDFKTKVIWDNGVVEYIEDTSKYPEMTFRYDSDGWKLDGSGYKVSGQNTYFPVNGNDHRLPEEGWNAIRFDLFSETSIPTPVAQKNSMKSKTFESASIWAHSPIELMIDGATDTDWGVVEPYSAYLVWSDGTHINQKGDTIGDSNNPWGVIKTKGLNITDSPTTGWQTSEQEPFTTITSPMLISFDEFKGNGNYRTVSAWWGDKDRADAVSGLPGGFQYWDYLFQEIEVQVGDGKNDSTTAVGCENILVPKFGCSLPIDNKPNANYRLPQNVSVDNLREIEHSIDLHVTGVSKGTGQ